MLHQPIGRQLPVPTSSMRDVFRKIADQSDFCSKQLVWHFELQLKVQEKNK